MVTIDEIEKEIALLDGEKEKWISTANH